MFLALFEILAETFKSMNTESRYAIDTIKIPVCDNIRIDRCRIYQSEAFRGYQAKKKRYFYGVKIHLMVTAGLKPVEFYLTPGSTGDVVDWFDSDLPEGSHVHGDKAYNNYQIEDILADVGVEMQPIRKSNSKRPHPPWRTYLCEHYRKRVETAGSLIERLLPKSIHAVTQQGFELKVALFVLASSINCL